MAFGNRYGDEQPRWIHRHYPALEPMFVEAEIAANAEDGYEPVSHSTYWDPTAAAPFTTILYRRSAD